MENNFTLWCERNFSCHVAVFVFVVRFDNWGNFSSPGGKWEQLSGVGTLRNTPPRGAALQKHTPTHTSGVTWNYCSSTVLHQTVFAKPGASFSPLTTRNTQNTQRHICGRLKRASECNTMNESSWVICDSWEFLHLLPSERDSPTDLFAKPWDFRRNLQRCKIIHF